MSSALTQEDFEYFRSALRRMCGVALPDSKGILVETRLRTRLIARGFSTYSDYRQWLAQKPSTAELSEEIENEWQIVINNLTTHTTEWFRESDHFKHLKNEFIPQWLKKHQGRPLRVWSSACSTGEEPYTIALVLNQFSGQGLEYEITATDIDTRVLNHAEKGLYSIQDLHRIPEEYRSNALAAGTGSVREWMKVRDHVRARVRFQQFNLMEVPYRWTPHFDLIFCRNVLIYFKPETVTTVINAMYDSTIRGGLLYTGHSESLANVPVKWKFVKPSIYRKGDSAP